MKSYNKGVAFGVFDVFHVGHLRYLQKSAGFCKQLHVGIRSDSLSTPGKSRSTIFNESIREELVASLECVHKSFVFYTSLDDATHWAQWLKENQFEIVLVGEEWSKSKRWQYLELTLKKAGIKTRFIERTDGISSTYILEQLKKSTN